MHSHAVQIVHMGTGLGAGAHREGEFQTMQLSVAGSFRAPLFKIKIKKQPLSFQKPEASFCGSRNFQILPLFSFFTLKDQDLLGSERLFWIFYLKEIFVVSADNRVFDQSGKFAIVWESDNSGPRTLQNCGRTLKNTELVHVLHQASEIPHQSTNSLPMFQEKK